MGLAMATGSASACIRRKGLALHDSAANKPFGAFISFNAPDLCLNEDPWQLPSRWELHDALLAVQHQGGQVVRVYPFSVWDASVDANRPCAVNFDGQAVVLNEDFLLVLDHALDIARQLGLRLIIPFVDQWRWVGGITSYARFRGFEEDLEEAFWREPQVREDFKTVLRLVVNRRNAINGSLYCEDPTILAWETGNELLCPPEWTRDICETLRGLDALHLIIDGHDGLDPTSLDDDNVDIVSVHYYPGRGYGFPQKLQDDVKACEGKKPLMVGEFGFFRLSSTEALLKGVVEMATAQQGVVGALIWSLRSRSFKGGGFYWHSEPFGNSIYCSYHWPGFPSGERYDEVGMMDLMRTYGHRAKLLEPSALPPPLPLPAPPTLASCSAYGELTYRGSVSARTYELQRAWRLGGEWEVIKTGFHDAVQPMTSVVVDESVMQRPPSRYFYRLVASNETGTSPPSPLIPLLPPSDLPQVEGDPMPSFFFGDPSTSSLMQLRFEEDKQAWQVIDHTSTRKAPAVGKGRISRYREGEGSFVVYTGLDDHLYQYDFSEGSVLDHTALFQVPASSEPSVFGGGDTIAFRAAGSDALCTISFHPESGGYYSLTDYGKTISAPALGSSPVAVSEDRVMFKGQDHHLYDIDVKKKVVVDHTVKSGRRVRGGLACVGRDKVFYAGGVDGHLYEECLRDDGQEWQVIDHSAPHAKSSDHVAPIVGSDLEWDPGQVKIVYQGVVDGSVYQVWYDGEGWAVFDESDRSRLPMR